MTLPRSADLEGRRALYASLPTLPEIPLEEAMTLAEVTSLPEGMRAHRHPEGVVISRADPTPGETWCVPFPVPPLPPTDGPAPFPGMTDREWEAAYRYLSGRYDHIPGHPLGGLARPGWL